MLTSDPPYTATTGVSAGLNKSPDRSVDEMVPLLVILVVPPILLLTLIAIPSRRVKFCPSTCPVPRMMPVT
ncbi:hypothetical protein D3C84_1090450 [compost metagenome]